MVDSEIIKFKGVTKSFKKNLILEKTDFDISENKITGLIGNSGSGKTTLLKLMIGFYKPTKGRIEYLRKDIRKETKDIEKYFGFSTEGGSFYDKLTIEENLNYFGKLYRIKEKEIKNNAKELMKLVELYDARNTLAENLSIGMKKRLDIICALIHKPKVLIMDEPTADLNPLLRKEIIKKIKKINKKGTTVIVTTQIIEEADDFFDDVLILANKQIIEKGDVRKIKNKYNKKSLWEVFENLSNKEKKEEKENSETSNNKDSENKEKKKGEDREGSSEDGKEEGSEDDKKEEPKEDEEK